MQEIKLYELLGYVKISPYRDININTSQVSAALSDLKKQELVICVNEEVRKGRLYKCTELGLEVLENIK